MFSYYKPPISNTKPIDQPASLVQVYKLITGDRLKGLTENARLLYSLHFSSGTKESKKEYNEYKSSVLPYVTFSGIFTKRHELNLVQHSGLMCLDFDQKKIQWKGHIISPFAFCPDWSQLQFHFKHDKDIDPQMMFLSPSGNGLKVIVSIDLKEASHADWFDSISEYIKNEYGAALDAANIELDLKNRDVARACFLCKDTAAYIKPNLLSQFTKPNSENEKLIKNG